MSKKAPTNRYEKGALGHLWMNTVVCPSQRWFNKGQMPQGTYLRQMSQRMSSISGQDSEYGSARST
eukprot:scaffold6750_cov160-Amphora_coffeaeformis.AAC.11